MHRRALLSNKNAALLSMNLITMIAHYNNISKTKMNIIIPDICRIISDTYKNVPI